MCSPTPLPHLLPALLPISSPNSPALPSDSSRPLAANLPRPCSSKHTKIKPNQGDKKQDVQSHVRCEEGRSPGEGALRQDHSAHLQAVLRPERGVRRCRHRLTEGRGTRESHFRTNTFFEPLARFVRLLARPSPSPARLPSHHRRIACAAPLYFACMLPRPQLLPRFLSLAPLSLSICLAPNSPPHSKCG